MSGDKLDSCKFNHLYSSQNNSKYLQFRGDDLVVLSISLGIACIQTTKRNRSLRVLQGLSQTCTSQGFQCCQKLRDIEPDL